MYVISSPASTVSPLGGTDVFSPFTSALFTFSSTGFVSVPSTTAVFIMSFVNVSSGKTFTVTSKLNSAVPAWSTLVLAGTSTGIPSLKSSASKSVLSCPFTLILPVTNVVPSGISSVIVTSFPRSPVLLTVIVYVIVSPSTT